MVSSTVDDVLASLVGSSLAEPAKNVVLQLLQDEAVAPTSPIDSSSPIYLTSVEVEGFRGIGPSSKLELQPGAGLTLVVGSNGCGKSSFAEAIERVLTGTTSRWESSASDAQEDWQNVHYDGQTLVRVGLRRANEHNDTSASVTWRDGDGFKEGRRGAPQSGQAEPPTWATTNWSTQLEMYPPLLPYKELSAVVDGKPSELFDQFDRLLGLGVLDGASSQAAKLAKGCGELVAEESRRKKLVLSVCQQSADLHGVHEIIAELNQQSPNADKASGFAAKLAGGASAASDSGGYEGTRTVELGDVQSHVHEFLPAGGCRSEGRGRRAGPSSG